MSKKASYILILSLVAVTMVGIVIGVWNFVSQEKIANEKTIVLEDEAQTEAGMDVSIWDFCPGMSESYRIHLKANEGDRFKVTMKFERDGIDSIAPYIDVEIKTGGETIDSAKLTDYLNGRQVTFPVEFSTEQVDVQIIYRMSLDVGDEAQNTKADFKILLSTER